jgi:hypothetical protein
VLSALLQDTHQLRSTNLLNVLVQIVWDKMGWDKRKKNETHNILCQQNTQLLNVETVGNLNVKYPCSVCLKLMQEKVCW